MDFVHKFDKNAFTDFEILQKKSGIFSVSLRIHFPGTFSIDFVLLSGHGHIVRIIDGKVTNHGTKYTINTMQYQTHPDCRLFSSTHNSNTKENLLSPF